MQELGLEYIVRARLRARPRLRAPLTVALPPHTQDLILIHWPVAFENDGLFPKNEDGTFRVIDVPLLDTWKALEVRSGRAPRPAGGG